MDDLNGKIERYEGFLQADPENTTLLVALGDLYHQAGKFSKARSTYTQVANLEPENTIAQSRLGAVLMSEGDLQAALGVFKSINGSANIAELALNIAICQFALYETEPAQATFLKLAGNTAVGRSARYYLASILQMQNRVADALVEVEKLLAEQAEVYLYAYKATLLYTLGRIDEAVELSNKVLSDDATNPDACSTLGTYFAENLEAEMAKTYFEKLTLRAPGDARGWHGLGVVAMQQGEMTIAISLLEKSTELLPKSAAMWTTLAWAQFNHKQYREAEASFDLVIELNRNNPEGWGGKACSLAMQQKLSEANKAAEAALRLDKRSFSAIFAKSLILALKGKKETGEKILANLLEQPIRPGGEKAIETINRYMQQRSNDADAFSAVNTSKFLH